MTLAWLWILFPFIFLAGSLLILICSSLHIEFLTKGEKNFLNLCVRIEWSFVRSEGSYSKVNEDNYAYISLWGHRLITRRVHPRRMSEKRDYPRWPRLVELMRSFQGLVLAPAKRLLPRIKWERIRVAGHYGFEDPCLTGWIAGIAYSLGAFLEILSIPVQMDFEPNFEEPSWQLESEIGCSFRPFHLFTPAAQIFYFYLTHKR